MEQNIPVLQDTITCALDLVLKLSNIAIEVIKCCAGTLNCFSTLLYYCAENVEAKSVSAVKHDLSVTTPCYFLPDTTE